MAETIEYVYDTKTKKYVLVDTSPSFKERIGDTLMLGIAGQRIPERYKSSLTAIEVAGMGLKAIRTGDTMSVRVPRNKALKPEVLQEEREQRRAERAKKPKEVDPVTWKPIKKAKDTVKIGESLPFVNYGDYQWDYDAELQFVKPIAKPGQKEGDLPESGFMLLAPDPTTNEKKLTVISPDDFTRNLRRQFLTKPDEISEYKQLLKNVGWFDGPIDNRPTLDFFNRLREVAGFVTDLNYYNELENGPVYDVPSYLELMAVEGGGGVTRTTTSLSTPDELYGALNQQFEKYTGRRVPDNVLDEFVQRVNALERQSPQVQTTIGDDTTFTGGPGGIAEREAVQFAREQEGAGAYRGATYYLDALMDYVNRRNPGA